MIGVLDLGGTTIKVGLSRSPEVGTVEVLGVIDTPRYQPDATETVYERFARALSLALDALENHVGLQQIDAFGVSSRGPFGRENDQLVLEPASFEILKLDATRPTFPLERFMHEAFERIAGKQIPIHIVNDAVANLRAEATFGAAQDAQNVALFIVGTGIGYVASKCGVACVDIFGNGPEPSQMWIEELGSTLTDATNGRSLEKRFGRLPNQGDSEMADFAAFYQAKVLGPLLDANDVQTLILTGGVCQRLGECYRHALTRGLQIATKRSVSVLNGVFGDEVGLIGAAAIAHAEQR